MSPDVSHAAQLEAVSLLTGWTLGEIGKLFAGHGMTKLATHLDEAKWPVGTSQRRELAAQYHEALDMSDPTDRASLLRVYDDLLAQDEEFTKTLRRYLRRDGVVFMQDGSIAPEQLKVPAHGLDPANFPDFDRIKDPDVLRQHAIRMQRALGDRDPADAILASRELLESVCKFVLEDYGVTIPKNPSLGQLYGLVAEQLKLKAGAIEGDSEASKAARKVLQGLASIADGMGELRTRVGRGHGQTTRSMARQRHAELATSSAGALAAFMLDTWQERRAP